MDGAREAVGPAHGFEGSLGPVNQAVGTGVGAVDFIAAMGRRMPHIPPLVAPFGPAVAVGIGQFPNGRGAAHIHRTLMPQDALEHGQFVGKHDRSVIASVAVGVLKSDHPPLRVLGLCGRRFRGAVRVGDVQAAPVIKGSVHGPGDVVGCGHGLDLKPLGQCEGVGTDLVGGGVERNGAERRGQAEAHPQEIGRSGAQENRCHVRWRVGVGFLGAMEALSGSRWSKSENVATSSAIRFCRFSGRRGSEG